MARKYPSQPGVSLFNDNNSYWSPVTPTAIVQAPHTGTKIRILGVTNLGLKMNIRVGPTAQRGSNTFLVGSFVGLPESAADSLSWLLLYSALDVADY